VVAKKGLSRAENEFRVSDRIGQSFQFANAFRHSYLYIHILGEHSASAYSPPRDKFEKLFVHRSDLTKLDMVHSRG
jgi:hypothetical protein